MSSHDCAIIGTIKLRKDVTQEQVIQAFAPVANRHEIDLTEEMFENQNAGIEPGKFWFNITLTHPDGGGYAKPEMDEFAEKLGTIVDGSGFFEFFDYDTGETDSMRSPSFFGETPEKAKNAQVEYGLSEAHDWLKPIIGEEGMKILSEQAFDLARKCIEEG